MIFSSILFFIFGNPIINPSTLGPHSHCACVHSCWGGGASARLTSTSTSATFLSTRSLRTNARIKSICLTTAVPASFYLFHPVPPGVSKGKSLCVTLARSAVGVNLWAGTIPSFWPWCRSGQWSTCHSSKKQSEKPWRSLSLRRKLAICLTFKCLSTAIRWVIS